MDNIRFYEINAKYVDYLAPYAPHLFHNSKKGQANQRKYIGIVFQINDMEYFAPLSSFKPKHEKMKEGLDFIKILRYAVINLNNMFPVPYSERVYVNFETIKDPNYKSLLLAEYRYIKSVQKKIQKNAAALYKHKQINVEAIKENKNRKSGSTSAFCLTNGEKKPILEAEKGHL